MGEAELIALLRLQRLPRVDPILAKKLLHHFGSAQAIFNAQENDLLRIGGEKGFFSRWYRQEYLEQAKKELAFARKKGIHICSFQEEDYPALLKQSVDGPLLLFQKGKINFQKKRFLSIVGARRASLRGMHFVTELIANLAPWDPVIVSGFSYDREVFSVPGRPNDSMSIGCNNLIKSQKAQAVTSAADIVYFLNWDGKSKKREKKI